MEHIDGIKKDGKNTTNIFPPDHGLLNGWHCDNIINEMWIWFVQLNRRERVIALAIEDEVWTRMFIKLYKASSRKEKRKELNNSNNVVGIDGYKPDDLRHIYDRCKKDILRERKDGPKKNSIRLDSNKSSPLRSSSPLTSSSLSTSSSSSSSLRKNSNLLSTSFTNESSNLNFNNLIDREKMTEDDKDILVRLCGDQVLSQIRLCSLGKDDLPDTILFNEYFLNDCSACLNKFRLVTKQKFLCRVISVDDLTSVDSSSSLSSMNFASSSSSNVLNSSSTSILSLNNNLNNSHQHSFGLGPLPWLGNNISNGQIPLFDLLLSRIEFSLWMNYRSVMLSHASPPNPITMHAEDQMMANDFSMNLAMPSLRIRSNSTSSNGGGDITNSERGNSLLDHWGMVDELAKFWHSQSTVSQNAMLGTTYEFVASSSSSSAAATAAIATCSNESDDVISLLFFLPLTTNISISNSFPISPILLEGLNNEEEIRKLIKNRIKQAYSDFQMFELEIEEDERIKQKGKKSGNKKTKKKAAKQSNQGKEFLTSSPEQPLDIDVISREGKTSEVATQMNPIKKDNVGVKSDKPDTEKDMEGLKKQNKTNSLQQDNKEEEEGDDNDEDSGWESVSHHRGKERSGSFGSASSGGSGGGHRIHRNNHSSSGNHTTNESRFSDLARWDTTQTSSRQGKDFEKRVNQEDIWKSFPSEKKDKSKHLAPSPPPQLTDSSASSWRRGQHLDLMKSTSTTQKNQGNTKSASTRPPPSPLSSSSTSSKNSSSILRNTTPPPRPVTPDSVTTHPPTTPLSFSAVASGVSPLIRSTSDDTSSSLSNIVSNLHNSFESTTAETSSSAASSFGASQSLSMPIVSPMKVTARGWDGGVIRKAAGKLSQDDGLAKKNQPTQDPLTFNMTKLGTVKGKSKDKVENISLSSSASPIKQPKQKSNKAAGSSGDSKKPAQRGDKALDSMSPLKNERTEMKSPRQHTSSGVWPAVTTKTAKTVSEVPSMQTSGAAPQRSWASLVSGKTSSQPHNWNVTTRTHDLNERNEVNNTLSQMVDQTVSSSSMRSSLATSSSEHQKSKSKSPPRSVWGGSRDRDGSRNKSSLSSSKSPSRSKGSIGGGWKLDSDEEIFERRKSSDIASAAAEAERDRRIAEHDLQREEEKLGRLKNQDIAVAAMEGERHRRIEEEHLSQIEAASTRTERKEWASKQLAQEHITKEKERIRNQQRLHDQLSEDILDFNLKLQKCMVPRRKARSLVVGAIDVLVKKLWAQGEIALYGSSFTGLDIPSSDVDLVVCHVGTATSPYQQHSRGDEVTNQIAESLSSDKTSLNAVTAGYLSGQDEANVSMVNKSGGNSVVHRIRKPPMFQGEGATDVVLVKDGVVLSEETVRLENSEVIVVDSDILSQNHHDINNESNPLNNDQDNDKESSEMMKDDASIAAEETMEHVLNSVYQRSSISPEINSIQRLSLELSKQNWVVSIKSIEATSIPVIKLLVDPKKCGSEFMASHPHYFNTKSQQIQIGASGSNSSNQRSSSSINSNEENMTEEQEESPPEWGGHLLPDGLLQVDISFEGAGHGGLESSAYVRELLHVRYPEAIPLVLVIKELLAQRYLNEPFTGGLSSYALVLMVVAILQMWQLDPKNKMKTIDENVANQGFQQEAIAFAKWHNHVTNNNGDVNMGALLTQFFAYFGRDFDIRNTGLSITRDPPGPFSLSESESLTYRKPNSSNYKNNSNNGGGGEIDDKSSLIISTSPYIEDPLTIHSRNVAQSAFRFQQAIQFLFSNKVKELEIQGVGLLHRANSPSSKTHKKQLVQNNRINSDMTVNVLKGIVMQY